MYNFRLTEEISRWAFEIRCRESLDWYIAFTNPTAGPWKTIKGTDQFGKEGEVYRFELEQPRPDIILVNDKLRVIVIIEAKDTETDPNPVQDTAMDPRKNGNAPKRAAAVPALFLWLSNTIAAAAGAATPNINIIAHIASSTK